MLLPLLVGCMIQRGDIEVTSGEAKVLKLVGQNAWIDSYLASFPAPLAGGGIKVRVPAGTRSVTVSSGRAIAGSSHWEEFSVGGDSKYHYAITDPRSGWLRIDIPAASEPVGLVVTVDRDYDTIARRSTPPMLLFRPIVSSAYADTGLSPFDRAFAWLDDNETIHDMIGFAIDLKTEAGTLVERVKGASVMFFAELGAEFISDKNQELQGCGDYEIPEVVQPKGIVQGFLWNATSRVLVNDQFEIANCKAKGLDQ